MAGGTRGTVDLLARELRERDIEAEGNVAIRRLLAPAGSRFFVNDRSSSARAVGELADHLLCVPSQHDHQQLLVPALQLDFVDLLGGIAERRGVFSRAQERGLIRQMSMRRTGKPVRQFVNTGGY